MIKKQTPFYPAIIKMAVVAFFGLALMACAPAAAPADDTNASAESVVQPLAGPAQTDLSVLAEGVVVPVESSDLSFQIAGVVSEVLVGVASPESSSIHLE